MIRMIMIILIMMIIIIVDRRERNGVSTDGVIRLLETALGEGEMGY